ncbi:MAG: hypothetical protein JWP86_2005 [Phenylobacterium sp.]|nr:hypothetical protein [Phenylobacterium sp.]
MDSLQHLLGGALDFAAVHPFVSAWLALTTVWTMFTFARRDA